MKSWVKILIRIVVTGLCLWYISVKINWQLTWNLLVHANKGLLAFAIILFVISKVVAAGRLQIYFRNSNVLLSHFSNLKLYWLGMFYNLFLPGGIGGDAYKVILLKNHKKGEIKSLAAAVLMDRLSGIIGLILLAAIISCSLKNAGNYAIVLALVVLASIVFYYFILSNTLKPLSGLECFINTLLLGIVVQFLQVICVIYIMGSIHIVTDYPVYILIFLLSSVAAILPISLGGLGVREMVFLWGSSEFLLDKQQSIYISVLFYLITAIVSFTGIVWVYKDPLKKAVIDDYKMKI